MKNPIHTLRRMALSVLLLLLLGTPACLQEGHPLSFPRVVECGPTVDKLIPVVSRLLMSRADPAEELDELAGQHGASTVACLVQAVIDSFSAQDTSRMAAGYPAAPARAAATARGEVWLDGHGVEEVRTP